MQFYEIANQLLEDFPEIGTLMENTVWVDNISYKLPGYRSNCLEINDHRIGIYFTVPEKYRIVADDGTCEIMFAYDEVDGFSLDFALIGKYQKSDMNQWWSYEEIKEDVKKMLDFQKKVNSYISLLNYRYSIKNERKIVIDI